MGIKFFLNEELKNDVVILRIDNDLIVGLKSATLLKGELKMRNRTLLLCLRDNIETVKDYAKLMGIDEVVAEQILKEQVPLTEELIQKNCELFNVDKDYLLCEI